MHKMQTKGDKILEKVLSEIGDKGLFTQELEVALLVVKLTSSSIRSKICQPVFPMVVALELFLREKILQMLLFLRVVWKWKL